MSDRFQNRLILAAYVILINKDRLLLLERGDQVYHSNVYSVIGGDVESDETPLDTATREAREEAGIQIDRKMLKHRLTMFRVESDSRSVDFFYICTTWSGEPRNMEPDKCKSIGWFHFGQLPQSIDSYILNAIESLKHQETYMELIS